MKTFKIASFTAAILLTGLQLAALAALFIIAALLQTGSSQYSEATLSVAVLPPVLVLGTRAE